VNFYKHHLGDYDGDTNHLTWDEDMAYSRLLRAYYRREKPIPLDPGETFRLVRATTAAQKKAVSTVLEEFFVEAPDGWHNKRADAEIAAYRHQCSVNQQVGKLGGRPKKTESVNSENRIGTESKPNHNPNQIPEPDKNKTTPPNGGTVWDLGKTLLHEQGLSLSSAGALIGSWLKDWPEAEVADAIRAAAGKADVRSYVAAVLKSKPKKGVTRHEHGAPGRLAI